MGPGFIFMSPERINSRLMKMLWLICELFKFEALWKKFDCNFELIKAESTQRCLDMESTWIWNHFLKSVSRKENFHCIDGCIIQ